MRVNGEDYLYGRNLQGDIIAIYNESFQAVAHYTYDAWGKVLSVGGVMADTIGEYNSLRYRGYYYDSDTGLYYLNSRYYDPVMCRFVNADGYASTGQGIQGNNMYAYCDYNPINYSDPCGQCHGYANNPDLDKPSSGVRWGYECGYYGIHVRKPKKFSSVDEAATAFATNTYSASSYTRHEYGGEIYSNKNGGYYLTTARAGNPHNVSLGEQYLPMGAKLEATIHTHPNGNYFSKADIDNSFKRGVNSYVIGPNGQLQRYNISNASISILGMITPNPLAASMSEYLESTIRVSWDNHLDSCEGYGCENKSWPNR